MARRKKEEQTTEKNADLGGVSLFNGFCWIWGSLVFFLIIKSIL
jgi:hypothetical protein